VSYFLIIKIVVCIELEYFQTLVLWTWKDLGREFKLILTSLGFKAFNSLRETKLSLQTLDSKAGRHVKCTFIIMIIRSRNTKLDWRRRWKSER